MLKSNRYDKSIMLFAGDLAIFYLGLFLTLTLRYGSLPTAKLWDVHRWPFLFVYALWVIVFYVVGLYDVGKIISLSKLAYILRTMAVSAGLAVLLFYFVPYFKITPKTNLFIDAAIVSGLIWLWRKTFLKITAKGSKIKLFFRGDSQEISAFRGFINVNPHLGYKSVADASDADIIVVPTEAKQEPAVVMELYDRLLSGKTIIGFDRIYESMTGMVPVSLIGKAWFWENMMEINKQKFEKIKRWLDIVLALLLGTLFLITFPMIAVAIKLTSPGPVFYRQKRVGKSGKVFEILKYRSMCQDAEKNGAAWAQKNDSRITFFGNIMRKTRIDELPQFWNVLKGDLSFAGPRPERPEFVQELVQKIPHYAMRQLVKPGLSGWAQINFPYGSSVGDAVQKLQYDLYYIKNRSLMLEISILLKTIMAIVKREGR